MPHRTASVPTPGGPLVLSDSGLETDLVFLKGVDLPEFASFPLLRDDDGRRLLENYYREHAQVAAEHGLGFVFETPTWRSNSDWGARLGYGQVELDEVNRDAVGLVRDIRDSTTGLTGPTTLSGVIGPRGDGYVVGEAMTAEQARDYHRPQVEAFVGAGVDMVSTMTTTYAAEGAGVALAARDAGIPVAVSFTVETDGRLPDGSALEDAIAAVDAATERYVRYFGVNCAHPDHLRPVFGDGAAWLGRIGWLRANASRQSHAELDVAEVLDAGDPHELGAQYAELRALLPSLTVVGGCCGTDVRHVRAIASALTRGSDGGRPG